jgi:hypothetical protein
VSAKGYFVALFLFWPLAVFGQSLHERPVGTKVTGSNFQLGPKRIPLPEADWVLIGREEWQGPGGLRFAGVFLAEIHEGRLARAIVAFTNLTPSATGWGANVDPCKRPDTALVHRNLSKNLDNQFCFDVHETQGAARVPDWHKSAREWLARHDVKSAPVRLTVRYAMLDRGQRCEVRYSFDASGFGGDTSEEKAREAARWAEEHLSAVRRGLLPQ